MKPISIGSRARSIGIPSRRQRRGIARGYRRREIHSIPDKRELDLGKPLVLDFAREFLPVDYDEVRHIFSRRGAYRRYKDLLVRRGALERSYVSRTTLSRSYAPSPVNDATGPAI